VLLQRLAGDPRASQRLTPAPFGTSGFTWLTTRRIDALLDDNPLHPLYRRIWNRQRSGLIDVLVALARRGIEALTFKGAEFHLRYFGARPLGGMADLDILVPAGDLEACRHELQALGFRHGMFDPRTRLVRWFSRDEVAAGEAQHYQLGALLRIEPFVMSAEEEDLLAREQVLVPVWRSPDRDEWCFGLSFDIHHGVATQISGDRFFLAATEGTCGSGRSMSVSDLLWFTISRWYSEVGLFAKKSLRDIAYVLPLFGEQLDWDVVARAAKDHELGASLYYPLAFLRGAFQLDVPGEALAASDPRLTSRRRDWGWQLGPIFDFIEPPP
jgi:hypothetical protein